MSASSDFRKQARRYQAVPVKARPTIASMKPKPKRKNRFIKPKRK